MGRVAVAVVVVVLATTGCGTRDEPVLGVGDEAEVRASIVSGRGQGGTALIGITPVEVRRGEPADLAGRTYTDDDLATVATPDGTPHYVDARLVNKGDEELTSGPAAHGVDSTGAELEDLNTSGLHPPVVACGTPALGLSPTAVSGYTTCYLFVVPPGRRLDRLRVGDAEWKLG
ncbi:hypothetical protein [Umezawaea sp.]|uniref:hypothetical protein n=1 Tax=Umezawaea sp. TaxID=1955258 RepID=UPI002ED0703F